MEGLYYLIILNKDGEIDVACLNDWEFKDDYNWILDKRFEEEEEAQEFVAEHIDFIENCLPKNLKYSHDILTKYLRKVLKGLSND